LEDFGQLVYLPVPGGMLALARIADAQAADLIESQSG